jgi:hypothetical protein
VWLQTGTLGFSYKIVCAGSEVVCQGMPVLLQPTKVPKRAILSEAARSANLCNNAVAASTGVRTTISSAVRETQFNALHPCHGHHPESARLLERLFQSATDSSLHEYLSFEAEKPRIRVIDMCLITWCCPPQRMDALFVFIDRRCSTDFIDLELLSSPLICPARPFSNPLRRYLSTKNDI